MKLRDLKTDRKPFGKVLSGVKRVEIRKGDRAYSVGDILRLRETEHTGAQMASGKPLVYTGRECFVRVTHVVRSGYGLRDGFVAMSIEKLKTHHVFLEERR